MTATLAFTAGCGDPTQNPDSGLRPTPHYEFQTAPAVDPTMGCKDGRVGHIAFMGTVSHKNVDGKVERKYSRGTVTDVPDGSWALARHSGDCVQMDSFLTLTGVGDLNSGQEYLIRCAYPPDATDGLRLSIYNRSTKQEGFVRTTNTLETKWKKGAYKWLARCTF